MHLLTPVAELKGVGPVTAKKLADAGLETAGDIINFLPFRYDDFTVTTRIADLVPGKVTITARCEKVHVRSVRRGLTITTATLADDSGKITAVWFNQPYRAQQLQSQDEFYFSGELAFSYNKYQITNPSVEKFAQVPTSGSRLTPVYHQVKGLKQQLVRKVLREVEPLIPFMPETLPEELLQREGLLERGEALQAVHFPKNVDDIEAGRQRIAFEEVFSLLLAAQYNKSAHHSLAARPVAFNAAYVRSIVDALPFQLTGAQRRAAWDIFQDIAKDRPMNRLMQGDVGAGKTVVAALVASLLAHHGFQTAIMAPTEILAQQHASSIAKLLEPHGINVGLLTASVKGAARQELLARIAEGEVDIIVGTHALIQDSVTFKNLNLVVVDEQHRFGVAQRQALLEKGDTMPHLLAMTATPIPRSLALTVYGELDSTVIDELPAGRRPIHTKIWNPVSRRRLDEAVKEEVAAGRQAYIICPLIDESADNDKKSVEAELQRLRNSVLGTYRIGLLHGRLKAAEKDAVMRQFSAGEIDILVSTTVVEVGVDVPNATVMVIENADHFGLSQLHQLRGRVGRGQHQSYCHLVMSSSQKPSRRLQEIERSTDGFHLAEIDLQLRGPGEIYGRMQHGALRLQVASLGDSRLIARAQKAAAWFCESGQDISRYPELAAAVEKCQRITTLN